MGSFHLISSIARQVSKMKTILFLTIVFSNMLLGKGFDLCSTDSDCPIYAGLNSTCHVECGLCGISYEGNIFNPCEIGEFCGYPGGGTFDCPAAAGLEYVCKQDCGFCSLEDIRPYEFSDCSTNDDCIAGEDFICHTDCPFDGKCSAEEFNPCDPYKVCTQDDECTVAGLNMKCHPGVCIPDVLDCNIPTPTTTTPP